MGICEEKHWACAEGVYVGLFDKVWTFVHIAVCFAKNANYIWQEAFWDLTKDNWNA